MTNPLTRSFVRSFVVLSFVLTSASSIIRPGMNNAIAIFCASESNANNEHAGKALEGFRNPVILPDSGASTGGGDGVVGAVSTIMGKSAGGESDSMAERRTVLQLRNLPAELTSALLDACRANDVSVTNALTAAMALTSTDFVDGGVAKGGKERNYKVLQSLDMRRFGAKLDKCDTVACMAGSNDLMLGPLRDRSGESVRLDPRSGDSQRLFWDLAREGRDQTNRFVESDGPVNAVRVFDFAMTISDMNNLVDLAARSKDSLGRAYSAGVANNGVYERQKAVRRENDKERGNIQSRGKYQVKEIYFGTPQSRSGCLYLVSTITVNGSMKLTFNAASPIVSEGTLAEFADAFIDLLEKVTKNSPRNNIFSNLRIPEGSLTLPAAALGVGGVAIHAGAWSEFFSNIATMKENIQVRFGLPIVVAAEEPASLVDTFADFVSPQRILKISGMRSTFGYSSPLVIPFCNRFCGSAMCCTVAQDRWSGASYPSRFSRPTFCSSVQRHCPRRCVLLCCHSVRSAGSSLTFEFRLTPFDIFPAQKFRGALNVAALSAFLTYVGAGLDGQAGLGDFNLQLNDDYRGEFVRGCPSYDEVRRPSMDGFDLEKYQGKWYEQKFHDWTQFKEVIFLLSLHNVFLLGCWHDINLILRLLSHHPRQVYDTTLDIKLTSDKKVNLRLFCDLMISFSNVLTYSPLATV